MTIGIPKEIMVGEGRIGITPGGVKALTKTGHKVIVQSQAGSASGFSDNDFSSAGAIIEADPKQVYQTDMVVKVKEPQKEEYQFLKEGGIIFAFLHLPANPDLAKILLQKNITGLAYESVILKDGKRPILQTMSKIAGEKAIEEGMRFLKKTAGKITVGVLGGAGAVGQSAIKKALSLGASIIALDLAGKLPKKNLPKYQTMVSTPNNVKLVLAKVDLLIGGAVSPGVKAPKLVTREMISLMKPGSVIVDVAIDEGGNFETSRPTTHQNPVFIKQGIIHYCVKNIPGAFPEIATPALTQANLPYILEIANKGLEKAVKENPALARGVETLQGKIINPYLR